MIKYNLICKKNHEFESWFASSDEFDKLNKKNLLECIYCSSKKIKKSIMAPMVSNIKSTLDNQKNNQKITTQKNKLIKLREFVEKNFEFVGDKFSKQVREVYYDKKNKKSIYGTTTSEEREELAEEGIDLISIPWVDKNN
jgi:hypothetical protein|tara:strand:+ start:545 stop:964 length:420 start_codon:yes stop_codon:yes gene_type:complete